MAFFQIDATVRARTRSQSRETRSRRAVLARRWHVVLMSGPLDVGDNRVFACSRRVTPGAVMESSCDGNLLLHFSCGTTTPAHYDFSCAVDADIPNLS